MFTELKSCPILKTNFKTNFSTVDHLKANKSKFTLIIHHQESFSTSIKKTFFSFQQSIFVKTVRETIFGYPEAICN